MIRLIFLLCLLWGGSAVAHRPSDAFLTLRVDGTEIRGEWDIALRDLAALIALDANGDLDLSWGELRSARPDLEALLRQSLILSSADSPCGLHVRDLRVRDRGDGRYAWFALAADCAAPVATLSVDYRLLREVDPTHRGLLVLETQGRTQAAVLDPDAGVRRFDLFSTSKLDAFTDYFVEGVRHIWIGADHILFLLALLLPSVLRREDGRWQAREHLMPALRDVAGVVTAFTLAHSITLTLAALDVVSVPSVWVESAIAASVVLAALNNLFPVVQRARWALAFAFGLIHGFGFASVLGELGLPAGSRVLGLFAFNVGVEAGQLAIVLVAVPLAYAIRGTGFYQVGVRAFGSLAVALLAVGWLGQRTGLLPG